MRSKCILFKLVPLLADEQVRILAQDVPFAVGCLTCPRRAPDKELEKMCWRGL